MIYTIKTLSQQGKSQRAIARELGISRRTVAKYLEKIEVEGVKEPKINKVKKLDSHEQLITELFEGGLTAKLIWQKLQSEYQIQISYITVARFVKDLKHYQEAFVPVHTLPGEEAQVDYGYLGKFIKDGKTVKVWGFSMILSYSRYAYYEVVTSQSVPSFINSHIHAFEYFGGVPGRVKIDNLKAGVITPDFYQPTIQDQYAQFLTHYSSAPVTARVRRPQDKGKVEAGIKYLKNNFIKSLSHNDFEKLKQDLRQWNNERCNKRIHGTTKKVPLNVFQEKERKTLIDLPSLRYELYKIFKRKVNAYGHISFDNNYYSVPYSLIGKELIVKSDDKTIKIYEGSDQVALHAIPTNTKGEFITVESHKPDYKQYKNKQYYLDNAISIGQQAHILSQKIIEEYPTSYSRIINGIVALASKYGKKTVNQACKRAYSYQAYSYTTVKNICEKGLQDLPIEELAVKEADGFKQDLALYDQLIFNN